jgi:hypothetical protein
MVYPVDVMYRLAKLMDKPSVRTDIERFKLMGPPCSPWKCAQVLSTMGAFRWVKPEKK